MIFFFFNDSISLSIDDMNEIKKFGWSPGIDQVCLVDTFMYKNFKTVFSTL
jgi:hypothetical protein